MISIASLGNGVEDPPPVNLTAGIPGRSWSPPAMPTSPAGTAIERIGYAGYGSRVNCYAWGEEVVTAGWGYFGPMAGANRTYTDRFDGTSAAAAIIAGAAILVQQMAGASGGPGLRPDQMRRGPVGSGYGNRQSWRPMESRSESCPI